MSDSIELAKRYYNFHEDVEFNSVSAVFNAGMKSSMHKAYYPDSLTLTMAHDLEQLQQQLTDRLNKQLIPWVMGLSLATGHADTEDELLNEVGEQIKELQKQLTDKTDVCSICAGEKKTLTGEPCICKTGTIYGELVGLREQLTDKDKQLKEIKDAVIGAFGKQPVACTNMILASQDAYNNLANVLNKAIAKGEEERCHANRDGECAHENCPQLRDNEPDESGRHCPLDKAESYEEA